MKFLEDSTGKNLKDSIGKMTQVSHGSLDYMFFKKGIKEKR